MLPSTYDRLLADYKELRKQKREIENKKIKDRTEEEQKELEEIREKLYANEINRNESLMSFFEDLEKKIYDRNFNIDFSKKRGKGDKDIYVINKDDPASYFAVKCIQRNIYQTFKVKQSSRHTIMTQLKLLLNENLPKYIIRTDISSFFESIPQKELNEKIENNTLLNIKSKSFIKAILKRYNALSELDKGVPRGISISSYLSELYMKDIDNIIRKREEVLYYVRYVDDIFIILTSLAGKEDIEKYYLDLYNLFEAHYLKLKLANEDKGKCKLFSYTNSCSATIDYLGYTLSIQVEKEGFKTTFEIKNDKLEKYNRRINLAFERFNQTNKYNLRQAKRDLFDSLKFLSGNFSMTGGKSKIKYGIFYSNDLLDNEACLERLNKCMRAKKILLDDSVFESDESKKRCEERINKRIQKIDFYKNWVNKKMYSFKEERLKNIKKWLEKE